VTKDSPRDVERRDGEDARDDRDRGGLYQRVRFPSPHAGHLDEFSNCRAVLNSRLVGKFTESRTRVRYAETDQMGIAHHANYIVWFEIGRTDLCRETGISYKEIEDRGVLLVVVEIGCRYTTAFRYDDDVIIRTSVASAQSRAMEFAYEMRDTEGNVRARGTSRHIWVDRETRRPIKAHDDVMRAFAPFVAD
jgi:acyl-CoA thioester hydrolase